MHLLMINIGPKMQGLIFDQRFGSYCSFLGEAGVLFWRACRIYSLVSNCRINEELERIGRKLRGPSRITVPEIAERD
jgi:hypothetical protein